MKTQPIDVDTTKEPYAHICKCTRVGNYMVYSTNFYPAYQLVRTWRDVLYKHLSHANKKHAFPSILNKAENTPTYIILSDS